MTTEQQIEALNWTLTCDQKNWPYVYCAKQRQFFSGPWRETPEMVLADVKKLREKQAENV